MSSNSRPASSNNFLKAIGFALMSFSIAVALPARAERPIVVQFPRVSARTKADRK